MVLLLVALRRKVVDISNAMKSIDRDGRQKKILKEDLYNNLKALMERGEILLLDDDEIKRSFRSIQTEYTEAGMMKFWGSYSHIVEGIIRAAWCAKNKGLNIYAA